MMLFIMLLRALTNFNSFHFNRSVIARSLYILLENKYFFESRHLSDRVLLSAF